MTKKELVAKWLEIADGDFNAGKDLFKTSRFLLSIYFCQQSLEKYLKATIALKGHQPPPVHNLVRLVEELGLEKDLNAEQLELLDNLNPFYIKARYPDYKESKYIIATKDYAKEMIEQTGDFIKWLRAKFLKTK